MPTNMVDGYVRRDSNVGSQEDRESGLVLPDGVFMPSTAFRNKTPQTEYTLSELGVDLAASPFAPEVHPVPESSPEMVKVRPVEIDWEAESRNFNANAAEIKTSPVDAINNAVKDYWGLIVFGGLVLTAGIFIGRRGL
jgi:hypothetical protein